MTALRVDDELKALVAEKNARDEMNLALRAQLRGSIEAVLSAILQAPGR